jgi:hypothetical protein
LKKAGFGRSIDRAMGYSVGYLGTFIMYVVASEVNHNLTLAVIFTMLEMMSTIRESVMSWIEGVGFYYELQVVYGRFAGVFNLKNTSMKEIDENTKEPIITQSRRLQA